MKLSRVALVSLVLYATTLPYESPCAANIWTIDGEQVNLTDEINRGEHVGKLTKKEADEFRNEEEKSIREEAGMRQKREGDLSLKEQKKIEHQVVDLYRRVKKQEAMSADNTGRNLGDAHHTAVTAQSQSSTKQDMLITENIRRELMADENLSSEAKNIKIVSINGIVTLRGPVSNEREKRRVFESAQKYAGAKQVNNELTISSR